MTQDNKPTEAKEENKKPQDNTGVMMTGHIKISDPETGEVIVDKRNAIHYENMSQALANSLANKTTGFVHEIALGNGGTSVDPTGVITYLTPNSTGTNAALYNQTYYKVIDDNSATNKDTTRRDASKNGPKNDGKTNVKTQTIHFYICFSTFFRSDF